MICLRGPMSTFGLQMVVFETKRWRYTMSLISTANALRLPCGDETAGTSGIECKVCGEQSLSFRSKDEEVFVDAGTGIAVSPDWSISQVPSSVLLIRVILGNC